MMLRCLFRFSKISPKPRPKKYPFNPRTLGEHLMKRRMDLEITRLEASRILGISEDTIYLWETGTHLPYINYFARITAFLGYSLWSFDTTTLSGKIQDYRHTHGLTAEQFGRLVGVLGTAVRAWELGTFKPNKKIVLKLNKVLENKQPLD
jgi:DNA-binding XRE family transcriptional regulator